ncbi:acyl-CoA thioesterase [Raoultibacter timonensis]|uniref:acyl-CoA thioesterase n=1 Tax=Raoultibacter timonensis TaxID=1907662 RepID=UPI000C82C2FF|nr:thioesterase family protein [Raoultibacter timonensis]
MQARTTIHVRYGETDMMGIVYHANYLLYFEDARTDFLKTIGCPYSDLEEAGFLSPVVNVDISYGAPLTYGDTAIVQTRVIESRPTRTVYAYEVYKQGQEIGTDKPCCTATTTHCVVDAKTFRPQSIKKVAPKLYERYLEVMEPLEEKEA